MAIEFELKYTAVPEGQEAIAAAFPVDYREFQMETTYFDTPTFALSSRKITLRRRMENGQPVCTVKTPTQGYGRGEWECPCSDIQSGIVELCKLGAPKELLYFTIEGVTPVCGAKFHRRAGMVTFQGAQLEIALDRGVLIGGGQEIPLCEVEVELKSGEPEAAINFGQDLASRFGLNPQEKSKFRRALALAKGE